MGKKNTHKFADLHLLQQIEKEEPPAKQKKNACRGCYWGKPAGHKITCFWQKCRKGGRV